MCYTPRTATAANQVHQQQPQQDREQPKSKWEMVAKTIISHQNKQLLIKELLEGLDEIEHKEVQMLKQFAQGKKYTSTCIYESFGKGESRRKVKYRQESSKNARYKSQKHSPRKCYVQRFRNSNYLLEQSPLKQFKQIQQNIRELEDIQLEDELGQVSIDMDKVVNIKTQSKYKMSQKKLLQIDLNTRRIHHQPYLEAHLKDTNRKVVAQHHNKVNSEERIQNYMTHRVAKQDNPLTTSRDIIVTHKFQKSGRNKNPQIDVSKFIDKKTSPKLSPNLSPKPSPKISQRDDTKILQNTQVKLLRNLKMKSERVQSLYHSRCKRDPNHLNDIRTNQTSKTRNQSKEDQLKVNEDVKLNLTKEIFETYKKDVNYKSSNISPHEQSSLLTKVDPSSNNSLINTQRKLKPNKSTTLSIKQKNIEQMRKTYFSRNIKTFLRELLQQQSDKQLLKNSPNPQNNYSMIMGNEPLANLRSGSHHNIQSQEYPMNLNVSSHTQMNLHKVNNMSSTSNKYRQHYPLSSIETYRTSDITKGSSTEPVSRLQRISQKTSIDLMVGNSSYGNNSSRLLQPHITHNKGFKKRNGNTSTQQNSFQVFKQYI